MEPSFTSVLLVDHKFQALSDLFLVETTPNDFIYHLKKKVKETSPIYFSRLAFDVRELVVWKTMGVKVINEHTQEHMADILSTIDINDQGTIRRLSEVHKLADLGLKDFQTLLVQLPAVVTDDSPVGDVITTDVDVEYEHCFLKAHTQGAFTEADVTINSVYDELSGGAPKFVTDHEGILRQKRKLAPEMREFKGMFAEIFFAEYFCSTEEPSESSPIVYRPEFDHLNHISSVDAQWWRTLKPGNARFKEADAYWLFFSAVTRYYDTLHPPGGEPTFTVKQSFEPWPFNLLIEVDRKFHTYKPKNDFLLLKYGLPRLAVEVSSQAQNRPRVDFFRLMLQGASIVRFANTKLKAYKKEKNFVFVAIFIHSNGQVDRYLLYQDAKKDFHDVYRKLRTFQLTEAKERMRFALELYNLSSTWHDDEDTKAQVEKLQIAVGKNSRNLTTFTGGSKRPSTDTGEDQPRTKSHRTGNAGRAAARLEDSGYEPVPDVLETDGGTWELIDKPPPHVRIVYRRRDPNKTEYIAKHVREGSNELAIHEYLQSKPSQSPHIISLIEAIPSTTREWLILPKLCSIRDRWFMNMDSGGDAGRVQLGWGLIKGLAYLHEHKIAHRDIKPGNLVCDHDFNLKIIDFDIAIRVEDENTEIDEYCGTEGWTAPEIGKQDGPTPMYSPIKADRWSCGRVILRHIMVGVTVGKGDHRLLKFANQLMAKDPQQRPSQFEWRALLAPPLTVMHDRCRQDVGENIKPPDAKKRRLQSGLVQSLVSRPMGKAF